MLKRATVWVILIAAVVAFAGCSAAPQLVSIQVIPSGASLTTVGETVQFKAIGTFTQGSASGDHPPTTSDITSLVIWASTETAVSTVNSLGLATAVSTGNTSITASMGGVTGISTLGVSGVAVHDLTSITIIPGSGGQTVTKVGEPTQFIAIGTYTTAPMTLDLTSQVTWQSSDVSVATINSAGLALGNSAGTTTITAIGKSNAGAAVPGTSTLTVNPGGGTVTLPQLSIFEVGLGKGTVTSSPVGINCSAISATGCTGNFVLGTTVTLTATPTAGSTFGGWSSNCAVITANTCTVTMNNNQPVGAIFN